MGEISYKYNEEELLKDVARYIDGTYDQHYAQGEIQTTEFIISNGDGIAFSRGNVIKYAQRYGKKDGRNRKDILKIIHYAIIMLYAHDIEKQKEIDYEIQSRNNQHFKELCDDQLESVVSARFGYSNDLGT